MPARLEGVRNRRYRSTNASCSFVRTDPGLALRVESLQGPFRKAVQPLRTGAGRPVASGGERPRGATSGPGGSSRVPLVADDSSRTLPPSPPHRARNPSEQAFRADSRSSRKPFRGSSPDGGSNPPLSALRRGSPVPADLAGHVSHERLAPRAAPCIARGRGPLWWYERERGRAAGSGACTLAPWDANVIGMHRRQQVSHAPASCRAAGPGSETESPHGASWLTGAGARDDVSATPAVSTRAVKRRTSAGRCRTGDHLQRAPQGAVATGR